MQQGETNERDRVSAHLTLGEASGDMKTALAAVADGSFMTAALSAKYMAAGMNRQSIGDRQDDDPDLGDPADPATTAEQETARDLKASGDILALVAETNNVKLEA